MKRTILIIAIIGILGCFNTANAETIQDLGTIEYGSYLQVEIYSDEAVNLEFIFTEYNESDLDVEFLSYNPLTNETKYLFDSDIINTTWWMKNESIPYYFQDLNSKQIYKIEIDYSSIEIPVDPFEIKYHETLLALEEKNLSLDNISVLFDELTISYYNITSTLENLTIEKTMLEEQLNETNLLYGTLKNDFLNQTIKLEENVTKNNDSTNALLAALENETHYKDFYNKMNSVGKEIVFDGRTYTTIRGADTEIRNLKNEVGRIPIYIFIAILIITIVVYMISNRAKLLGLNFKNPIENDRDHAYTPNAKKYDNFLLDKLSNFAKRQAPTAIRQSDNGRQGVAKTIETATTTNPDTATKMRAPTKEYDKLVADIVNELQARGIAQ